VGVLIARTSHRGEQLLPGELEGDESFLLLL